MSKKFLLQRVMPRYSVEKFLSHSKETFRRGTLLSCVSEICGSEKFHEKEGGGGVSKFSVEILLS